MTISYNLDSAVISSVLSCGGQLPDLEGTVSHPEYPDDYTAETECEWTLTARERDKVFLKFELLEVEADRDGGCTYDYVRYVLCQVYITRVGVCLYLLFVY